MSASPLESPGAAHARTLTSLLSAPVDQLERAQSVPITDKADGPLRPPIVSQPLGDTHSIPQPASSAMPPPPMQHAQSEPMPDYSQARAPLAPLSRELKAFDPLATLSPVAAQQRPMDDAPAATANPPADVAASAPVSSASSTTAAVPSTVAVASSRAIVSTYPSAALSSGSFTSIDVSVTPGHTTVSPPQLGAASVNKSQSAFYGATASAHNHAMTVAVGSPPASSTAHNNNNPSSSSSSNHGSSGPVLAPLSVSSPSTTMPTIHTSPGSSRSAGGSGGASSGHGVKFNSMDTLIDESGHITHTHPPRPTSTSVSSNSGGAGAGGADQTPSVLRIHNEDDGANTPSELRPNYPTSASGLAVHGLASPSFPQGPSSNRSDHHDALSPGMDRNHLLSPGSPLPPVVSALMAAQKVAGTTPGATLAMPVESQQGRLIFLCGDASGAGKTSIALGLLHLFLKRGYEPRELAYIKPCTQCEDVQLISKYCERKGIQHQGIGPIIFYEGFTSEVIDGKAGSVDARRSKIAKAVNAIAEGKKWVLVDGVGYAAVGSVAGVSNAEVASLLNAPVLVVGRPGIGNAIDSMNFILSYFALNKVHCIGACWNKLPAQSTYHSYDSCKHYVNKYFRDVKPGVISTYGHIPLVEMKRDPAASSSPASEDVVCRLRAAKTDLIMTPSEEVWLREFLAVIEREFDMEGMLRDLQLYYATHRVQLISVV